MIKEKIILNHFNLNNNILVDSILIKSRKFILLEKSIAEAIYYFYLKENNLLLKKNNILLTRINMNIYYIHHYHYNEVKISEEHKDGKYDHTNILMKLISTVMIDIQQRALNAKHVAHYEEEIKFTSIKNNNKDNELDLNYGYISSNIYIKLNKSCLQRKEIEICALYRKDHIKEYKKNFISSRLLFINSDYNDNNIDKNLFCLYGITYKKNLIKMLDNFKENNISFPILIFSSLKNIIFLYDENTYLINFFFYHMFHESNRSFELKQFGNNYKEMCSLIFFSGIINRRMLKESFINNKKGNLNLSCNIQSLGKALNNPIFQIFSENSIPTLKKIKHKKSYNINSIILNRNCGLVSPIGINDVSISINLSI